MISASSECPMERCDASIFAGGCDVRSGECRPGSRYAGPAVSPRQLHRWPEQRQGQLAGLLCRRPGELRLDHFEVVAHCQQRPACDSSATPPGVDYRNGHCCLRPTATLPASAASSDTIRNGRTSSLGVEANYIHDGIRSSFGCDGLAGINGRRLDQQPDSFERGRETLRFRLAAHPRRLRDGMLPALCVCRHRLWQARPSIAPFRPYPDPLTAAAANDRRQQDQAGSMATAPASAST